MLCAECQELLSDYLDRELSGGERASVENHLRTCTKCVTESTRHGAPMVLVRGGEDRDLAAIVGSSRARADRYRFHLDRDVELVKYVITKKRLQAGSEPSGSGDCAVTEVVVPTSSPRTASIPIDDFAADSAFPRSIARRRFQKLPFGSAIASPATSRDFPLPRCSRPKRSKTIRHTSGLLSGAPHSCVSGEPGF